MNFAYLNEYSKLGFHSVNSQDFLYEKLKCCDDDINRVDEEGLASSPLYVIRFCNVRSSSHLVAVANEDGTVRLHDSRYGCDDNPLKCFQAHYNAIFDLAWLENEVKFVTSSGDHSALLWDFGKGEAVPLVRLVGHQGSVKAIACKPADPNVFATGARDGSLMQWDIRLNPCRTNVSDLDGVKSVKADRLVRFPHLKSTPPVRPSHVDKVLGNSQCVSSVVYQGAWNVISCSSTDKTIKVWDMRKSYFAYKGIPAPIHSLVRPSHSATRSGYTNMVLSPCEQILYAHCSDAKIYAFNVGTYNSEPLATYQGGGSSSFFCKVNLSPNGKYLSSGSLDGRGYVWSVNQPDDHLVSLEGHGDEVTCVDWCKFGEPMLASSSDDGTYRIWRVKSDDEDEENSVGGSAKFSDSIIQKMKANNKMSKKYFAFHFPNRNKKRARSPVESPVKCSPSPKKLCVTPRKMSKVLSDLPNYVVDGRSPHDRPFKLSSPAPECDWLSRHIAATPPPPTKSANPSAKKNKKTPTPSDKKPVRGSLLRYFKKVDE